MHLGHLRLLVQVAEMGAVVMPPTPAFYHRPSTVGEIVDQTVNRALDMLDIELDRDMFPRWQGPAKPTGKPAELCPERIARAAELVGQCDVRTKPNSAAVWSEIISKEAK